MTGIGTGVVVQLVLDNLSRNPATFFFVQRLFEASTCAYLLIS